MVMLFNLTARASARARAPASRLVAAVRCAPPNKKNLGRLSQGLGGGVSKRAIQAEPIVRDS